jgi:hypothetical protein
MEIRSREQVTSRLPEKQEYLCQPNERVCIGTNGGLLFPREVLTGRVAGYWNTFRFFSRIVISLCKVQGVLKLYDREESGFGYFVDR